MKFSSFNNLAAKRPDLAAQWHPTKNGNLKPDQVTPHSGKKAWWICDKGHEWQAAVANRTKGTGCPQCTGRKASPLNNLAIKFPELAKQWHPTKNGNLKPDQVTPHSGKKAWWICDNRHVYNTIVASRSSGNGCPFCSGLFVSLENNLLVKFPGIAKQWHPTKNGDLKPDHVTPGSSKKGWWLCDNGHVWLAVINNRKNGRGCPECNLGGRKATPQNNLSVKFPEIAKQWHPTKNGDLTPDHIAPQSNIKAWWICDNGHVFQTFIYDRSKPNGSGCQFCNGRKASPQNNLSVKFPEIATQWHPTKNGDLKPDHVASGSHKIFWWLCDKGHEWRAAVANRTKGTGCPQCRSHTSKIQLFIFSELKYVFKNAIHQHKIDNLECDIYIPFLKLAIEYDGYYYHKNTLERDKKKNLKLNNIGINVLRIREKCGNRILKRVSDSDIYFDFNKDEKLSLIKNILRFILQYYSFRILIKDKILNYLISNKTKNNEYFKKIINQLPYPIEGDSLIDHYQDLAMEWHPTKNGTLKPNQVTPFSGEYAWWLCKNGHVWRAIIASRSKGSCCPFCSGNLPSKEFNLLVKYPEIAKQWHPTKNNDLRPDQVTPHSGKVVWWLCENGHVWQAAVWTRSKTMYCPKCRIYFVPILNNLALKFPEISKQWHPSKNGNFKPDQFTPKSSKNAWWICDNGHVWQARISCRSNGSGCPKCNPGGPRASLNYNLSFIFPEIAAEWHPTKNGDLRPDQVTPYSHKKVWWLCGNGHMWLAAIAYRSKHLKNGCPKCRKY